MTEEVTREAIAAAVKVAGDYRMRRLRYMMDHPELIGCGMDEGYPEELWREAEMRDVLLAASQSRPTCDRLRDVWPNLRATLTAAPSASGRGMVAEGWVWVPKELLTHIRDFMARVFPQRDLSKDTNASAGELIERLTRALLAAAPAPSGWLSIESAPKDVDEIDVYVPPPHHYVDLGWWSDDDQCWRYEGDAGANDTQPTHWRPRPLPPPPAQGGGK